MRLSASIVLLKRQPKSSNFKILFVERSKSISSPGMFTFPGGVYDKLNDSSCLRMTALRELFEETGILFGFPKDMSNNLRANFENERNNLRNGEIQFNNLLNKYDINLTSEMKSLKHFTTFITPDFAKPKFITPFFVKDISDDMSCCDIMKPDLTETQSLKWLTPSEAIERNNIGKMKYLPPQAYIVQLLNQYKTLDNVMSSLVKNETQNHREVTVDNVLDIRDLRNMVPIKPLKLSSHSSECDHDSDRDRDSSDKGGKDKEAILVFPGDQMHGEYPGIEGQRHRIRARLPMGIGFKFESNLTQR
jgi:8-oxo-dGTP pyrophosphatase MutT (NUDIX family)